MKISEQIYLFFSIGFANASRSEHVMTLQHVLAFAKKAGYHPVTAPYTPESNGVAERAGGIISDMTRKALVATNCPNMFWPYCMQHCVIIKSRVPRIIDVAGNEISPFELVYHKRLRGPKFNLLE